MDFQFLQYYAESSKAIKKASFRGFFYFIHGVFHQSSMKVFWHSDFEICFFLFHDFFDFDDIYFLYAVFLWNSDWIMVFFSECKMTASCTGSSFLEAVSCEDLFKIQAGSG